jgi:hypothetical protein
VVPATAGIKKQVSPFVMRAERVGQRDTPVYPPNQIEGFRSARFCGQCGAPLDRPGLREAVPVEPCSPESAEGRAANAGSSLPGEMKQVRVLFCDIVGSTRLASSTALSMLLPRYPAGQTGSA